MNPRKQSLIEMFPSRQSPDGCPLCVICCTELRKQGGLPRSVIARYCSDICRDDAWVRAGNTTRIRELLRERDKSVCSGCGLDCDRTKDALEKLHRWFDHFYYEGAFTNEMEQAWQMTRRLSDRLSSAFLKGYGRFGFRPYYQTWEAHHVVPVSEGGGGCSLEGYVTLCIRCHKRTSANWAARRASSRSMKDELGRSVQGTIFP